MLNVSLGVCVCLSVKSISMCVCLLKHISVCLCVWVCVNLISVCVCDDMCVKQWPLAML